MLHKTIRIPSQNEHVIMSTLGSIESSVEFVDLNKDMIETKRPYSKMISRCDEIEKVFLKFDQLILERNLSYEQYQNFELFQSHLEKDMMERDKIYGSTYFDLIESELIEDSKRIEEQLKLNEESKLSYIQLLEEKLIIDRLIYMFNKGELFPQSQSNSAINEEVAEEEGLHYIAGICNSLDEIKIKRMIFRSSRGRAVPGFFNINTLDTIGRAYMKDFKERKMFFVLIQGNVLYNRVMAILNIFNCHIYAVPNPEEIRKKLFQATTELENKEKLIRETELTFMHFIRSKIEKRNGMLSLYSLYRFFFKREKLIYTTLNKCIRSDNFLLGEVWIPEEKFNFIQNQFHSLAMTNENILIPTFEDITSSKEVPPTYFKMNDFVYPFQEVVSTYGVPRYKEANPALFNIITFPFLFGIMFGDIGHGLLLFSLSAYICLTKNDMPSNSPLKAVVKYRYILLFMGFFSFYSGLMYNDFMSLPLSFFSSCYENVPGSKLTVRKPNCVYPIGIDPKWYSATNDLAFTNSFKMKWSVIVGVIQMLGGIILRGMNNAYFKDKVSLICEFIPELIFMTLLFGYMIALIYIKWLTDWTGNLSNAPSIISILMGMALNNGSVEGKPLWGSVAVEEKTNRMLFYISIICVPIILLPKPIIWLISKSKKEQPSVKVSDVNEPLLPHIKKDEKNIKHKEEKHVHEETFADVFVHQCIETIEFVLGCVSNTASYLRLWALSLAHSQLSKVFFDKALFGFAKSGNVILVVIGYFIFANVTVFVLMGMDLMESFLHTLRLHWVEFQNKFYAADGVKFKPFCFRALIEGEITL